MRLEKMALADLIPYENNPRCNDAAIDDVAESIMQCTYAAPIIVDENNVILAGHTRLKALQRLGHRYAEVIVQDSLSEEQKRKFRLLDNKTAEKSEWDFGKLIEELDGLDFDGYDFGFSGGEWPQTEALDLDEGQGGDRDAITCHCPKCGFTFEVDR